MDPYEYLLKTKMGCSWEYIPDDMLNEYLFDEIAYLTINNFRINAFPEQYLTFEFAYKFIIDQFQTPLPSFRNSLTDAHIQFYKAAFGRYYCVFQNFPENLESKEQVDILLTLNGIN